MGEFYCGIDIGGTTAKVCLYSTKENDIIWVWEVPTLKNPDETIVIDRIIESIRTECESYNIDMKDVRGIGIGVPGPVTGDGTVLKCANLGWDIVNLKEIVIDKTGIDNVMVGNDANVAALGEAWRGSARDYNSIVMVTLGTGVGGGLIIDGKIRSGRAGAAGEIGHITVEPDETELCGCGSRGCLEQYASATGVVRLARSMFPEKYADRYIIAKDIFDAAKEGREEEYTIIKMFARYLGIALSSVAKVVSPDAFIIGGGVAAAGNIITDNVRRYYEEYSMYALKDTPIELAALGNRAGMYGALKMVIKE